MNIIQTLRELRRERREAAAARREAKRHVGAQRQMLEALNLPRPGIQGHNVLYAGTVSWKTKQQRRARGKMQKASRKANRGR